MMELLTVNLIIHLLGPEFGTLKVIHCLVHQTVSHMALMVVYWMDIGNGHGDNNSDCNREGTSVGFSDGDSDGDGDSSVLIVLCNSFCG